MKTLTLLAVGLFAVSQAFAGDKACCAHGSMAKNDMKCAATFASLDLNTDQKAKMEKLAADCDKAGCSKESMAKMESEAKGILSKEQFAAWKAACKGQKTEKTQS